MKKPIIFIDGEAGTTGLEIRHHLAAREDLELISLSDDKRKDINERKKFLNKADLAILCLPDDAACESVALIDNSSTKILDASTAHRVSHEWVYGFAELTRDQEAYIRQAQRVSNPGCYPTGALALIRPLIETKALSSHYNFIINAISGYSGGGKELISLCENPETRQEGRGGPFCLYGLDQKHKHLAEMKAHGGLNHEPVFLPSYSHAFYRGMLVHIAIPDARQLKLSADKIYSIYADHYKNQKYIHVEQPQKKLEKGYILSPLTQNETNNVQLRIFENDEKGNIILTACLDNLGKGASLAAVQNLELMLGL